MCNNKPCGDCTACDEPIIPLNPGKVIKFYSGRFTDTEKGNIVYALNKLITEADEMISLDPEKYDYIAEEKEEYLKLIDKVKKM